MEDLKKIIESEVIELLAKKLDIEKSKITPSSRLIEDLSADSLDRAELAMSLEDKYKLEINDNDYEKLATVNAIVDYVFENKK